MTTADVAKSVGWYGKIPHLGDFASRRLPQTFIMPWDGWLQQSIAASRAQLGARWLEVYLHSPLWRFVLLPGVIGNTLWAGLMMPSVDRVGRHFPLTIAMEMPRQPGAFVTVMAADAWYAGLEDAALATLNIDYSAESFEASVAAMSLPDESQSPMDEHAAQCAAWWRQPVGQLAVPLPDGYTAHHLICAASMQLFEAAGAGKSLWWQVPHAAAAGRFTCFNGLPPCDRYADMLRGHVAPGSASPLDPLAAFNVTG